ncbi:hypothetical protein C1752_03627 [Acaryochloris thomasi RCC1774]|uniref:Uncharacterized protein n=1 Tax=Acaryochloris thomasi RCC1774 TaxID=1764569 RepID=A0A2W1JVQ0_9CYAN|nr:hypothetical protein C1752_03627 [Acaryochloris thomasi RCC1774]
MIFCDKMQAKRSNVDRVFAEMCEEVAEHSSQYLEAALSLIDLMKTQKLKAKTMATLSKYA